MEDDTQAMMEESQLQEEIATIQAEEALDKESPTWWQDHVIISAPAVLSKKDAALFTKEEKKHDLDKVLKKPMKQAKKGTKSGVTTCQGEPIFLKHVLVGCHY